MIKTFSNLGKTHIVRKVWVSRSQILRQNWYLYGTHWLFLVLRLNKITRELQFLWYQLQTWNITCLD